MEKVALNAFQWDPVFAMLILEVYSKSSPADVGLHVKNIHEVFTLCMYV